MSGRIFASRIFTKTRDIWNVFCDNKYINKFKTSSFAGTLYNLLSEYWLLFFFITLVAYLELLYRLWVFKALNFDYFFAFLFSLPGGAVFYIFTGLFSAKVSRVFTYVATVLISVVYGVQLIYYCIFRTPLSLVSIGAAGDALQFWDVIVDSVLKNIVAVVMLFVPLAIMVFHRKVLVYTGKSIVRSVSVLLFFIIGFTSAIGCVALTEDTPVSQYNLYFKETSPELSINKLGVMTTMRLDLERLAVGELQDSLAKNAAPGRDMGFYENNDEPGDSGYNGNNAGGVGNKQSNAPDDSGFAAQDGSEIQTDESGEAAPEEPAGQLKAFNIMDVDFDSLLARGEADPLYAMHKYFSAVAPTATNQYTGMFKGCNLVMLTAEGFSSYALSAELTPTLYKMANEGFVFRNFYNPVWWVSTSDGEYVACTGLIPKGGVWSFYRSGSNYMPFTMGNQLKKLGYITKAYHNHTYTYYRRDVSHPNMGYDYKGVGNGLKVKKTWPESDLEMIRVTADEYMNEQPFHAYYMTVSGHMNYNFNGNQMAQKNRELVEHLPLSDIPKAYIACNLELEFAMKELMDRLEEAGIAENTVIVLSSDHYPYGLDKRYLDELAGHEVESNFEVYKSTLIIYKKGMEPVVIDKPCASLDIIPTLSNLFGLEYDSRLLMGADILSDAPALTIFSNRSWITDRAMYNSANGTVTFTDGADQDKDYVKSVNRIVADKFRYSQKILETDYYKKILEKGN